MTTVSMAIEATTETLLSVPHDHISGRMTISEAPVGTRVYARALTHTSATDLLDWLENRGIADRELQIDADGLFSVRWSYVGGD